MDLNHIAKYGTIDGKISKSPQRVIYTICDGIISGQGDGPLKPEQLPLGIISFSNNASLNDYAITMLMGFDPDKIPLINHAFNFFCKEEHVISVNSKIVSRDKLYDYRLNAAPPPGWVGKIEY